jgi:aminopeptidase N
VKPAVDPYTPHSGDAGFRTRHYDLVLDYRVGTNRLNAVATITAVAVTDLDRIVLDLHGLSVDGVTVGRSRAKKFSVATHKLTITPAAPIAEDDEFTVVARYRGAPKPLRSTWGTLGWEELADGVIVASQPIGAPSWYPCNDLPGDKATYRIAITCEAGYDVVANGTLRTKDTSRGRTTWEYVVDEPMSTYLATVQIGQYRHRQVRDAAVPTTIHHPADLAHDARIDFGALRGMLALFEDRFGPYPFPAYAVVVTDDDLEIPLEAHGLAIFGRNHVDGAHGADRLIAHELAHQWFGNSVTATRWQDIWLHEGFACYAEWLWAEEHDGVPAADNARAHRDRIAGEPADIVIGDPGPKAMFDDRVYKRGALALHAIRTAIGDDRFFDGLRTITATHRHGTVTVADVVAAFGASDVESLVDAWVYSEAVPAL